MTTKIELLRKKEAALKNQIADLERREREHARKQDERKRFIIGGAIMQAVHAGTMPEHQLTSMLDQFVSARHERKLLDLPEQQGGAL